MPAFDQNKPPIYLNHLNGGPSPFSYSTTATPLSHHSIMPQSQYQLQQQQHPSTIPPPHTQSLAPINQIREIQFPSESIEAVKPLFVKRKKLTGKDITSIDPSKLMMSLKSGLLAETTWALDVLSILLHDDNTYLYFNLQNLPGLLELLLEHFKLYLSEIFKDLFKDIEIENANKEANGQNEPSFEESFVKKVLEANEKFKKKYNLQIEDDCCLENEILDENENEEKEDEEENNFKNKRSKFKRIKLTKLDTLSYQLDHKQIVLNKCENYTLKNRKGLPVYFVDDDENLFINDMTKRWDKSNDKLMRSDIDHWKKTFFSSTDFIQRTFQPSDNLQLVKKLESSHQTTATTTNESLPLLNGSINKEEDEKEEVCEIKENGINCYLNNNDNNALSIEEEVEEEARTYPRFREKIKTKRFLEDRENEASESIRDSPPLCTLNDYRESIAQKCICFSTLIRNLSFVPNNDVLLSKNIALLLILGRLLLLHHKHLEKKSTSSISLTNLDEDSLFNELEDDDDKKKCNDLKVEEFHQTQKDEWWYDTLVYLRENALVTITNIAGSLNLSRYSEEINLPIFAGLLHWTVCPSAIALDNFKTSSISSISPSRLSLECLVKLSVLEDNVDLILTTPPYNRDTTIFETLVNHLRRNEDQTLREFALVLLYNFAISDSNIARIIALSTDAIQQLLIYIEIAEHNALNVINTHSYSNFKENPEQIGTTLDMIKRAALCLRCFS